MKDSRAFQCLLTGVLGQVGLSVCLKGCWENKQYVCLFVNYSVRKHSLGVVGRVKHEWQWRPLNCEFYPSVHTGSGFYLEQSRHLAACEHSFLTPSSLSSFPSPLLPPSKRKKWFLKMGSSLELFFNTTKAEERHELAIFFSKIVRAFATVYCLSSLLWLVNWVGDTNIRLFACGQAGKMPASKCCFQRNLLAY